MEVGRLKQHYQNAIRGKDDTDRKGMSLWVKPISHKQWLERCIRKLKVLDISPSYDQLNDDCIYSMSFETYRRIHRNEENNGKEKRRNKQAS